MKIYIPKGCDKQGRYTEGVDHQEPDPCGGFLLACAIVGVIAALALFL